MTERSALDREIFRLAIPALGALAADPLVTLIDTAFVGRIGAEELAALGVAGALFAIAFTVFNFLAYGTTPLIAKALGAGDRDTAASTVGAALRLALIAGVAASVAVVLLAGPLLELMGANPDVLNAALPYLRIRALALPAVLVVMVGHGVFRGHLDTRTPLLVTLGLNAVNIVLDPIFIFGFDWSLGGAAAATVIAQWAGALVFLRLLYSPSSDIQVGRVEPGSMRPLMSAGGALIVRTVALIGVFTVTTAVAARLGTIPVAAHQVAVNVWIFFALVVDALAIAGQSLIGKTLGEGDVPGARVVANRLLLFGVIFGAALGVGIWLLRSAIPTWLTDEAEVIDAVITVMPFVAIMQPLNALVFVWDGVAIGAAAFTFLAWLMVVAAVGAAIGLGILAIVGGSLAGLWWVLTAWMFVRIGGFLWWHQKGPLGHGRGRSLASPAA